MMVDKFISVTAAMFLLVEVGTRSKIINFT